jgi:iron complex outermembrane recepter protein
MGFIDTPRSVNVITRA